MQFEDWFENDARPGSLDPVFDRRLARAAWNAALEAAAQEFDGCMTDAVGGELEVGEGIRSLKAEVR